MNSAPWLKVPPDEEQAVREALARRQLLAGDERRASRPPEITQTSRRAALLWVLGVLNQDNPVLLWVGLVAAASNVLYLLASGIAALMR